MAILPFARKMSADRIAYEAREGDYQRLVAAVRELIVAIDIQGKSSKQSLEPTERLLDAVRELRGYVPKR